MSTISLYSWNVNGIRAAHKKGILDWFKSESPAMLCLQETKAHPDQLVDALKEVPGYNAYFTSAEKKGYSGVALYSIIEPVKVSHGFGIPEFDSEGRIITAEYDDFTLINMVHPVNG